MRNTRNWVSAAIVGLVLVAIVALGVRVSRPSSGALGPVSLAAASDERRQSAAPSSVLSAGERAVPVRVAGEIDGAQVLVPGDDQDAPFVRVRSAEAWPLRLVQWRGEDSAEWTLTDTPRVPRAAHSVRALGHAETELVSTMDEVTLALDAVLQLVVRGLAAHELTDALRGLDVTLWPPFYQVLPERGVLVVDTGRGALALAATPLRTAPDRRTFDVNAIVRFVSGAQLQVSWTPATGKRTALRIDLEPHDVLAPRAPLVLCERGAPEAPDAVREIALVSRARSGAPPDARTWEAPDVRVILLTHWHTWRVDARGPPVVPDLPTETEYVLALRRSDGWYARTTLQHDGTPRDVELSPPARLLARVVDEEGLAVVGASVTIRFGGLEGQSSDIVVWNGAPEFSGDDGRVELVAPTVVPPIDPAHLANMPLVCRVSIDAQCYAPFSVEVPLDPGVTRDLGRLVLRTQPPDLVVQFPGEVSTLHQAAWEVDGVVVAPAIVRARVGEPNTLEVEFERPHGAAPPTVERLVLFTDEGAISARRVGEHYEVEASHRLRCALDLSALDPPPRYMWVGARLGALTWSLAQSFRRDVLSAEHTIDRVLPAVGVELFWQEQDDAQLYGPAHPLPWPALGTTVRLAR